MEISVLDSENTVGNSPHHVWRSIVQLFDGLLFGNSVGDIDP